MRLQKILGRFGPFMGLAGVFLLFFVLVWWRTGRNGLATADNLQTIALQTSIVGMAALGMTMIIISGGIDLSVGAVVALTSCVAAALMREWGWSALPAAAGGVLAGGVCGLINGLLVTQLRVVPFIVTLGTYLIFRGVAKELANNKTINPEPSALDTLLDRTGYLPIGVWMVVGMAVGVAALLRYTRFGRHLYAIGSSEPAARLCGVPILQIKILVYVLGGLFAGLAGLLQYSRLTLGDPTSAQGLELSAIAAVVIGGASLSGGEGTVGGSLIGALIMNTISSGGSLMGWSNNVQEVATGAIIVIAVALDRLRHRRAL